MLTHVKRPSPGQSWWCMSLISALRRQRQADLCEFEASLVYRVSLGQLELCYIEKLVSNDNNNNNNNKQKPGPL